MKAKTTCFVVLCLGAVVLGSCALKEALMPQQPAPEASLAFGKTEAQDVSHLSLFFTLEAENPREEAARLRIESWSASLDGQEMGTDAVIDVEGLLPKDGPAQERILAAGEKRGFPVRLDFNLEQFLRNHPDPEAGRDSEAVLRLELVYEYPLAVKAVVHLRSRVNLPLVRAPRFSILSIGVQKAELINTRFLVKISVNNPNSFPVDLSAFSYELYNGGRHWAGGTMQDVFSVPAGADAETDLSLVMNFIDMRRELLDEIVALRQVDYRFAGTAIVSTGVEFLPRFQWEYEQSGRSAVVE